jgi:hypothetical protein
MSMAAPVPVDSEASSLFNPAFCSVLLHKVCTNYEERAGTVMPVVFAFLILPNVLHKPTRDSLPATTASSMWVWLRSNPVLLMDVADRVRAFRTFTGAGITYGLQHGVLAGSPGTIGAGTIKRRPRTLFPTEDWAACLKAAEFFGRWFGGSEADAATNLARWGVRP